MVTCFQAFCADAHNNAATMTMDRWTRHEEALRTACAAAVVGMAFETKPPVDKTRVLQPSAAVPLDTNALLAKVLEALNSRSPDVSPGLRDSRGHGDHDLRVRGAPQDPLCLWCGKKGHLLIDCPGPTPNAAAQEGRDLLRAARDSCAVRYKTRQTLRLTSAAASAVSDDDDVVTEVMDFLLFDRSWLK